MLINFHLSINFSNIYIKKIYIGILFKIYFILIKIILTIFILNNYLIYLYSLEKYLF